MVRGEREYIFIIKKYMGYIFTIKMLLNKRHNLMIYLNFIFKVIHKIVQHILVLVIRAHIIS